MHVKGLSLWGRKAALGSVMNLVFIFFFLCMSDSDSAAYYETAPEESATDDHHYYSISTHIKPPFPGVHTGYCNLRIPLLL